MTFFNSICNDNTWKYSINDENKRSLFDIFLYLLCVILSVVYDSVMIVATLIIY